jgi:type III restriction enzyme
MFTLKNYQQRALTALREYLEAARLTDPWSAFNARAAKGEVPSGAYRVIPGLEDVPYVCLRLPTGGGKTILAACAVETAAGAWLERDFPLVLWLVPTNAIRQQTLDVLQRPGHPCREALDRAFGGSVMVLDIGDVATLRPHDLRSRCCVVIGTLAALRVGDTDGRRIYAHNENFEPHFAGIPESTPGLERIDDSPDAGKIKFSFANLLHLHRPLVIMDEAHNARTHLTFEVLQRVSPACIIELTATPDTSRQSGSNILFHVTASALKAEDMIKLPIILTEHQTWQEAVSAAVVTRRRLAELAAGERDFIRPIALIQAESKGHEAVPEVIRTYLAETEKIPAERIAIATGTQRELDGIDLFEPTCPIDYVITIEALKEGWDCSFAYVFCSTANLRSGREVEQILGRVLRMPYAARRTQLELGRAYAHVSSLSFAEAARDLRDKLVEKMGFEAMEAQTAIDPPPPLFPDHAGTTPQPCLETHPLEFIIDEAPDFSQLAADDRCLVDVTPAESGYRITVRTALTPEADARLVAALPEKDRARASRVIHEHRQREATRRSPAERGVPFRVPRLAVSLQGELLPAEPNIFLDAAGWNLLDYRGAMREVLITLDDYTHTFEVDLQGGHVSYQLLHEDRQLPLTDTSTGLDENGLARWLDLQVHDQSIPQTIMLEFLRCFLHHLVTARNMPLHRLVPHKYHLAKVIREKIREFKKAAQARGYQESLFGPSAAVETTFAFTFDYRPGVYPCPTGRIYQGHPYHFTRHFFPVVGDLANQGEEFECACALDQLPQVKHWVRNLPLQPETSFWLPTSTDRFYPDFVAELTDNRVMVVEYKGALIADTADTQEKKNIGELWEEKSGGRCLFLMVVKKDAHGRDLHQQLRRRLFDSTENR